MLSKIFNSCYNIERFKNNKTARGFASGWICLFMRKLKNIFTATGVLVVSFLLLVVIFNLTNTRSIEAAGTPVCGTYYSGSGHCDNGSLGNAQTHQNPFYHSWTCSDDGTDVTCRDNPNAVCGNASIDYGEECDGTNMGGKTCQAYGFEFGRLSCQSCRINTGDCSDDDKGNNGTCGDGAVDGAEQCDGSNLNGLSCDDVEGGFDGGTLRCKTDDTCTFDTSSCTYSGVCGNGQVEAREDCDGNNLNGRSNINAQACKSLGFVGGLLSCAADCKLDKSKCEAAVCGNNKVEITEECDGGVGLATCNQFPGKKGDGSKLKCVGCKLDNSGCDLAICGNNIPEGTEQCDGSQLRGKTCADFSGAGGTLSCVGCVYDLSACTCGNGVLNAGEECDGSQLGGRTCLNWSPVGTFIGPVPPDPDGMGCDRCKLTTDGCVGNKTCGNRKIETLPAPAEICDSTNLNNETCASLGCGTGTLMCTMDGDRRCQDFDTSQCSDPTCGAEKQCKTTVKGETGTSAGNVACGGCGTFHRTYVQYGAGRYKSGAPMAPGLCVGDAFDGTNTIVYLEFSGSFPKMSADEYEELNPDEKLKRNIIKYTWSCGTAKCYAMPRAQCRQEFANQDYCNPGKKVYPGFADVVAKWIELSNKKANPACAVGIRMDSLPAGYGLDSYAYKNAQGKIIQPDYPQECVDEARLRPNARPGWHGNKISDSQYSYTALNGTSYVYDWPYNMGYSCYINEPKMDRVYFNCTEACPPEKIGEDCEMFRCIPPGDDKHYIYIRDDQGEVNPDPMNKINEGVDLAYCSLGWGAASGCNEAYDGLVESAGYKDNVTAYDAITGKFVFYTLADKTDEELCGSGMKVVPGSKKYKTDEKKSSITYFSWQCTSTIFVPKYGEGEEKRSGEISNCQATLEGTGWNAGNYNGKCGTDAYANWPRITKPQYPGDKESDGSFDWKRLCAVNNTTTNWPITVKYEDSTGTWSWECTGKGAGTTANCSVQAAAKCGPAANMGFVTKEDLIAAGACAPGKLVGNRISEPSSGSGWSWACEADSDDPDQAVMVLCRASKCGDAHGRVYLNENDFADKRCVSGGTPRDFKEVAVPSEGRTLWQWDCFYQSQGNVQGCSAEKLQCGRADKKGYAVTDFASGLSQYHNFLCNGGESIVFDYQENSDNWSWRCKSSEGMSTLDCSADKYDCGSYALINPLSTSSLSVVAGFPPKATVDNRLCTKGTTANWFTYYQNRNAGTFLSWYCMQGITQLARCNTPQLFCGIASEQVLTKASMDNLKDYDFCQPKTTLPSYTTSSSAFNWKCQDALGGEINCSNKGKSVCGTQAGQPGRTSVKDCYAGSNGNWGNCFCLQGDKYVRLEGLTGTEAADLVYSRTQGTWISVHWSCIDDRYDDSTAEDCLIILK